MIQILAFALLWFLAGYVSSALAGQFFNLPFGAVQFGLLGLLIGLLALIPILQTERGRRLFYEGPAPDEDGDPLIGCLWLVPFQVLLLSLIGWGIWLVAYLLGLR